VGESDEPCWMCNGFGLPWYVIARTKDEEADVALAELNKRLNG